MADRISGIGEILDYHGKALEVQAEHPDLKIFNDGRVMLGHKQIGYVTQVEVNGLHTFTPKQGFEQHLKLDIWVWHAED